MPNVIRWVVPSGWRHKMGQKMMESNSHSSRCGILGPLLPSAVGFLFCFTLFFKNKSRQMKIVSHLPSSSCPSILILLKIKRAFPARVLLGVLASYHRPRLTSSPFAWWPQPISVHLLPFMNFNSLYLSVLKSPGWFRMSNQPLQID